MKSSDYHYVARQGCIPLRNMLIIFVIICFSLTFPGMAFVPTANATDLTMGEEATLIYSKEDLQNTLNDIRGKLDAGFPVTTELIFLEDIRNELKRQLAEVEMKIEEDLADMPDIPGDEFNTDFDEMLDSAKRMIYMLDNIIISPSIKDIDAVLELIKTLDQEVQEDLLAARMDLPEVVVNKATPVSEMQPLTYIETAVTDVNLAVTDEIVFTDAIIAKSEEEEFGNDYMKMYEWVLRNIKNEFYSGSMKNANEVLVDGAGSAYAQCTLLTTFLRLNGVPSKYVRMKKKLTIEQLMNWTGTMVAEAAIEVIEGNNNPTVERIYNDVGEIESVVIDHIVVALHNDMFWGIVDPSFKEYIHTPGSGFEIDQTVVESLIVAVGLNTEETICSVDYAAVENVLNTQASIYNNNNNTVSNIDEVIGTREIAAEQNTAPAPLYLTPGLTGPPLYLANRGVLPPLRPAGKGVEHEEYTEEFSAIPDYLQNKFRVVMPFYYNYEIYEIPMAKIAGKRVSFFYKPTNPEYYQGIIEEYGSLYDTPHSRLRFSMKPVLQIDGVVVAEGRSTMLYNRQNLYAGFLTPSTSSFTHKYVRAGNKYDLSIPTQETSMEELKRLAEKLQMEIAESELGPDDTATDDTILETLRLAGMFYFGTKGALSEQVARRLNIVATNHMSLGYVCDEIALANNNMIKKAGVHIDVVRNSVKLVSAIGDEEGELAEKNYMGICGWISTGMESTMIDLAFRTTEEPASIAVSTAVIFAEAAKQNVDIHKIRPDHLSADLAGVTIENQATRDHINLYVGTYGHTVIIPETPITLTTSTGSQWRGEGWQVINPVTYGAGYMICGGILSYGGVVENVTLINGGSSSTIIDHPLSMVELFLLVCVIGGGPITAGLGHMVAADYVYALVTTYAGFAGAIPLALGFQVVGATLIVAGLVAFAAVYSGFWPGSACILRRRDYAYA